MQIAAGGESLLYTPPAGVEGQETFTYTVADGNGGEAEGTVTITIEPEVIEPVVNFALVFTDENGDPIETVNVGDNFELRVFVQDVRPADPLGVFSAYMDVFYSGSANPMITGPIDFNEDVYASTQSGDTSTDGLIDELGAVDGISPLRTGDPVLLATVPMTATSGGMVTATSDPADNNPPNETTVFGLNRVILDTEIIFGTDTLTVNGAVAGAAPFMNAANPFDVNDDDTISPLDALLVINELELGGRILTDAVTRSVGSPAAPTAFVDVNGDNVISPIDALLVINNIGENATAAPLGLRVVLPVDVPVNETVPVDASQSTRDESPLDSDDTGWQDKYAKRDDFMSQWSLKQIRSSAADGNGVDVLDGILEAVAQDVMDAWRAQ